MAVLDGDVLGHLEVVDGLEDGQALPDRVNSDVLECGMVEVDQDVSRDAMLCVGASEWSVGVLGPRMPRVKGLTCELVAVVGETQVGEQAVHAFRVEREHVLRVWRWVAVPLRDQHWPLCQVLGRAATVVRRGATSGSGPRQRDSCPLPIHSLAPGPS